MVNADRRQTKGTAEMHYERMLLSMSQEISNDAAYFYQGIISLSHVYETYIDTF